MLSSLVRRNVAQAKVPFNIYTNPFKAKRQWPPDFDKLSQKHQFRLERRYRRRCKLKWARPRWTKFVKLAQGGSVIFVLVYGVLFMDVGTDGSPFDGIRARYRAMMDSIWTTKSTSDDQSPKQQST